MPSRDHRFHAVAFLENFALRDLQSAFPGARASVESMRVDLAMESSSDESGALYLYPFGAVVFHNVPRARRERELERLRTAIPKLTADVLREDFTVREDPGGAIQMAEGALTIDHLSTERAGVVALTVAQSAAMESYEGLVEQLFARTRDVVGELERRGTVGLRKRPLHRFLAEAVANRTEVLTVLHLLDKPEAVWNDTGMDEIYEDLRDEFDLTDRYEALEVKLHSVQEAVTLVLETARDRRAELLEIAVVLMILIELLLALAKVL